MILIIFFLKIPQYWHVLRAVHSVSAYFISEIHIVQFLENKCARNDMTNTFIYNVIVYSFWGFSPVDF